MVGLRSPCACLLGNTYAIPAAASAGGGARISLEWTRVDTVHPLIWANNRRRTAMSKPLTPHEIERLASFEAMLGAPGEDLESQKESAVNDSALKGGACRWHAASPV